MRRIGRLAEGIHSSMRSGVVIVDLARVVEELVYNSLEASASQVFVTVGVGSSYVKVTDNGYGIRREELVLLGERYVTSKVDHVPMPGVGAECFDFHGEALSSISHISVLEIVTKARGKPNGYKKIMKDSKCLFLGINDDIQDVGTTVTARDIFYNQPVRRKHLESSPQKVLDSIKMSMLRIALVHVNVSFKVIDVERTAELLHTRPSLSPLPLLFSSFGIAKSVNFYEMNASDGYMKLSGYISGPHEFFSLKAIQYFYINTRFICKGPIHKLLNQLAAKFDLSDSWKPTTGSQNDKQIRCHICPTFLLNLKCPRSSYDLCISERSRSAVEFEDWDLVLAFIENAVKNLWNEIPPHGIPATSELGKKRCRKVNHQTPSGLSSPIPKKLSKHHEHNPEWEACISPLGIPAAISHVKHKNKAVILFNNDYISESRDASLAGARATTNALKTSYLSPITVFSPERYKFIPRASDMSSASESGRVSLSKQKCRTSLEFGSPHLKKTSRDYEGIPSWGECFSPLETPPKKVRVEKHQNEDVLLSDAGRSLAGYRAIKNPKGISCLSPGTVFSPHHHQLIPHTSGELENAVPSAALVDISPKFDNKILIKGGVSAYFLGFDDEIDINHKQNRPSLRRCSNRRSLVGRISAVNDEICDLRSNARRVAKKWVNSDNSYVDEVRHFSSERDLQSAEASIFQFSPVIKHDREIAIEFPIRGSVKSSLVFEDFLSDSSKKVDKCSSSQCFAIRYPADDTNDINLIEDHSESGADTIHGYSTWSENEDTTDSDIYLKERGQLRDCAFMNFSPFPKDLTYHRPKIDESMNGDFGNSLSPIPYRRSSEMDWSPLPYHGEEFPKHGPMSGPYNSSSKKLEYSMGNQKGVTYIRKESSIRSHSAPPFHKGKRKFMDSRGSSTIISAKRNAEIIGRKYPCAEPSNLLRTNLHEETRNMKSPTDTYPPCPTERSSKDCSSAKSPNLRRPSEEIMIQNVEPPKDRLINTEAGVCPDLKEVHNSFDPGGKWRSSFSPLPAKYHSDRIILNYNGRSAPRNYTSQNTILDITSDILNLSGDTLAPKSIDKNSLDHAKVLSQVDKKFIAVVAGRTLAVIDQHAADERIRLEELRPKVLSGNMKTITYLDSEKEVVLPEVGYQLLHNYAEQIQAWGWIINTHSHETSSFTKNLDFLHRQQNVVKLVAVPCILGVNLTDVDLLEFLQQLSDTDGSSTIPPSVNSILNSKACRGAIMFGDKLLPSECSILVEELKRTSLCFQCAHGRPTTVPLVNLDVLHESIARLGSNNKAWHGLPQYELNFQLSAHRV